MIGSEGRRPRANDSSSTQQARSGRQGGTHGDSGASETASGACGSPIRTAFSSTARGAQHGVRGSSSVAGKTALTLQVEAAHCSTATRRLPESIDKALTVGRVRRVGGLQGVNPGRFIQVCAVLRKQSEAFIPAPRTRTSGTCEVMGQGRYVSLNDRRVHHRGTRINTVHEVFANATSFGEYVRGGSGGSGIDEFDGFIVGIDDEDRQDRA